VCSHTRQSREGGKERGSIGAHGGAGRQDGRAKFLIPSVTSRTLDRVECRGLHPGNLPHHRTCGFPHPAVELSGASPQGLMASGNRWSEGPRCSAPFAYKALPRLAAHPGRWRPAKTREAKVVAVWSAESRDEEGRPMRDPGSITHSAAIESATVPDTSLKRSDLAERVLREATRRGFTEAHRYAVLGDGSAWIWNTTVELFPHAIQILDRFRVKETLYRTAQSIFGTATEAKQWGEARCAELDDGKLRALIHELRADDSCTEAIKCALYIFRNRARMRYPKFHALGLCTSTGVLEAGCKVAIGNRLKRSGMHWSVSGANAIIALRCSKLSGRFEDFWERRSTSLQAAA